MPAPGTTRLDRSDDRTRRSAPSDGRGRDPTGAGRPAARIAWAPGWLTLLFIVGANHLRRAVGLDPGPPALRIVVALAFSAVVFVVLTAGCRAVVGATGTRGRGRDAAP